MASPLLLATVNGAYLAVVLHLLFGLAVCGYNATAASLLVVFACGPSLAAVETRPVNPSDEEGCRQPHTGTELATVPGRVRGTCEPRATSADVGSDAGRDVDGVSVGQCHSLLVPLSTSRQRYRDLASAAMHTPYDDDNHAHEPCRAEDELVKGGGGDADFDFSGGLYSPARDAGVDETLIYPSADHERQPHGGPAVEVAARSCSEYDDVRVPQVSPHRDASAGRVAEQHAAATSTFYLAPRPWWIWVAAVCSLAAGCTSVALFSALGFPRQAGRAAAAAGHAQDGTAGWATTPAAQVLLNVFVGIDLDSAAPHVRFASTTACFGAVSAASWCLLLFRSAAGSASDRRPGLRCALLRRVLQLCRRGVQLGGRIVACAPFSLVWIGVAGVGQTTLLGLAALAVAVGMVLLLLCTPSGLTRSRRSTRRDLCWAAYVSVLWCLWEAHVVLRLEPVRRVLVGTTATVTDDAASARRRWLAALGVEPAGSRPGGVICGWHVVFAVGLWCAAAEQLCNRAADNGSSAVVGSCAETPASGQVGVYRARIRRAVAHQEEAAWAEAVNQQRAAHGKLALLRLERGAFATRSCSPPRGRSGTGTRSRQRGGGGVRPPWRGEPPHKADDAAPARLHAPFGSNGSCCCWLDAGALCNEAKAATAAPEAAEAGVPVDVGAAPASSRAFSSGGLRALSWASTLFSLHGHAGMPRPSSAAWSGSPCHSLTSAYSCLAGRRAPWQYSELPTTQATPANAEPDGDVVVMAELPLSPNADEEDWVASHQARRHAARAPTQSPFQGGDYGNSDVVRGVAEKCERHPALVSGSPRRTPHWRSPPSSRSGAYSPLVFAVSAAGPRAAHAGLRRTVYTDVISPCQSRGGSVCGVPVMDAPPSPRMFGEAAASWEALWHGAVSVAASAKPDEVDAGAVPPASAADAGPAAVEVPGGETKAPRRTCERLCRAVGSLAGRLAQRLRAWLQRHTVLMEEDRVRGEGRGAAGAHNVAVAAAASEPITAPAIPFRRLLALFARQHWAHFCALLMLVHFAVSGTVANLLPSAANLVYALERRPWPRATYWRLQVIFAALALLGKVAARVCVATVPFASAQQACRWIDLLLLRVDMADAAWSAPVGPRGSIAYRDMWADVALSGAVLAALAFQWVAVYADMRLLSLGSGDAHADRSVAAPVATPSTATAATSTPAVAQLPGLLDSTSGSAASSHTAPSPRHRVAVGAWLSSCKAFVRHCNGHRRGAGADFYAAQLLFDAVSLGLFGWAYYAIVPNDTAASEDNLVYAVQHNRLPGIFVATALGLVVLMFVERVLYVLQARVAKYALHCLLTAAYHVLYLVWRVGQESSGDGEEVESGAASPAASSLAMTASVSLLLTAKLASLWCGALQLRHGYAVHRLHDPFTIRTDLLHWLGHVSFRSVPFLLELRVLLDWSFSATTLKVQHWMLLEDIHHTVYRRYVDMHDLRHTSRNQGRRFPYLVRLYQGVLGFAVILFVLFFPLFWYSTFSPQVQASRVTAWSTNIAVAGLSTEPLFSADATLVSSNFYKAAAVTFSGATMSPADLLRYASVTDTWQTAQMAECSSRMWSYTPAAVDALIRRGGGGGGLQVLLRARVTRSRASEATMLTVTPETSYTLPVASQAQLLDGLRAWRAADEAATPTSLRPFTVPLPGLYTPYVLSASTGLTPMSAAGTPAAQCTLTLHRVGRYQGYSCVTCAVGDGSGATGTAADAASQGSARESHFLFVVASSDVATLQSSFSLIPDVGIIALYTSFVLVIGSYIRNYFAGDAHRVVLLQLANPEPVAELLRYLYLARSSANNGQTGDLFLEQLLFLELLDLLRSPERLLRLGGRRVDDYEGGLYRDALYDATKRPFALPGA